ncbi:hypothetical protein GP486_005985 [Trichoglossum hirsutum]|uniref:Xylanolytic transcriptional activator regulatory domain-containing protein n=1 Tax=Trichoglossum hirsutum TaxID=265104 RepID=A0A9P8L879_9PEZI|nr:hypothetical protein GP486_005985 [Trichoglossum hirsutum]
MSNGAGSAGPGAAAAALSAAASTSTGSVEYPQDLDEDDSMIKEEAEGDESDVEQVRKSFGFMRVDNNNTIYVAETHWAAILSDIAEVRTFWAAHKKQFEEQMMKVKAADDEQRSSKPSSFLFGAGCRVNKSELMAAIPSKAAVDKLIVRYFNSLDPVIRIIHAPTFQKEYEQYWADPGSTKSIWIGLLFAIMCLAMQSYTRAGDEPPEYQDKSDEMAEIFKLRTAQSLVLADYTKPAPYTIETLILHLHGEYNCGKDTEVSAWAVGGMIVRFAMQMGYHRDPKPHPDVTPFRGEMRRRVWTFVKQMDLSFSFQLGLPCMIRSNECDTEIPRNLFDDEFGEGTTELPPSRPSTEPTPISYMITKSRLVTVFGIILEQFNSFEPRMYEDIMKLDSDLREEREKIPPHLQFVPLEESVTEPATLIIQRYYLDLLYQKAMCVLHRKYLARGRENARFSRSRLSCLDASMVLLSHQATLYREVQSPTGRLRSVRWFTPSLTTSEFIQAAMIICVDLYHSTKEADRLPGDCSMAYDQERQTEMLRALDIANNIWLELKDTSMAAYKASMNISMMLHELRKSRQRANSVVAQALPDQYLGVEAGTFARGSQGFTHVDTKPEHSAAITLGMMSSGGLTPNTAAALFGERPQPGTPGGSMNMSDAPGFTPLYQSPENNGGGGDVASPFSFFGASGNVMDLSGGLDWDAWESYVQGTSLDPSNQLWPPTLDLPAVTSLEEQQATLSEAQPQQHQGSLDSGGSVFMGVSTPPRNPPMQ